MTLTLHLVVLCFLTIATQDTKPAANVVFVNGNIYTVSDRQPKAQAVAIKGGRFIYVGSNAAAQGFKRAATKVIDLHAATVVPGLTDSHYHLSGVGEREMTLNLEGCGSLDEFLSRVKERVDRARPGEWVTGRGWIETFWKPQVFPTASDLDRISPNNPVWLVRADGHGAVINSAALKIAKIDSHTKSPFGGGIMKDPQTGQANGMLLDNAQRLIALYLPPPAKDEAEQALKLGIERSLRLGWCQVQIAGSTWPEVELLRKLYRSGQASLRTYVAMYGPGPAAAKLLQDGPSIGEFDNRMTIRDIKVVFDGALGSKGAALLEPYNDHNSSGFLTQKEETLMPMFEEALRKGIQVETHAIGDRANRTIIDLYEKAFKAVPQEERNLKEPRWRVEHAQIVNPDDIPRFAKLGVIPSMQPSHAIGDLHFAPSRIGIKRLEGAYAWQSFIKSGSIIAGGSDAPVERGEPMIEFYAAVARRDQKGFAGEGWHLEQRVSREQALKMFTLWPAYAAFEEKKKGTIEVGKLADMTVLSADIMKIPEPAILKTQCLMTIIGGEVVYDRSRKNASK